MKNCSVCGIPSRNNECSSTCRARAIEMRNLSRPKVVKYNSKPCSECKQFIPMARFANPHIKPETCGPECRKKRSNRLAKEKNDEMKRILEKDRKCSWCKGPMPESKQLSALYCGKPCLTESNLFKQRKRRAEQQKAETLTVKEISEGKFKPEGIQKILCGGLG